LVLAHLCHHDGSHPAVRSASGPARTGRLDWSRKSSEGGSDQLAPLAPATRWQAVATGQTEMSTRMLLYETTGTVKSGASDSRVVE
jgi:hypothetical protein